MLVLYVYHSVLYSVLYHSAHTIYRYMPVDLVLYRRNYRSIRPDSVGKFLHEELLNEKCGAQRARARESNDDARERRARATRGRRYYVAV